MSGRSRLSGPTLEIHNSNHLQMLALNPVGQIPTAPARTLVELLTKHVHVNRIGSGGR